MYIYICTYIYTHIYIYIYLIHIIDNTYLSVHTMKIHQGTCLGPSKKSLSAWSWDSTERKQLPTMSIYICIYIYYIDIDIGTYLKGMGKSIVHPHFWNLQPFSANFRGIVMNYFSIGLINKTTNLIVGNPSHDWI